MKRLARDLLTPDTPPRPEPVATADLVAQAREKVAALGEVAEAVDWWQARAERCGCAGCREALTDVEGVRVAPDPADLLNRLAKALEDTAAERDRRIAELEDLRRRDIERLGEMDEWIETAEPRIAELEAGLRRIVDADRLRDAERIARDLLAGRAAGSVKPGSLRDYAEDEGAGAHHDRVERRAAGGEG